MAVKIRLQRFGKKGRPYFHIVAADARAPRDGKYIERLGHYDPNTDPATIDINVDDALRWLNNGAQPTDTARAILSYRGVMYKNHLLKGVKKGALTEEEAESRFQAWVKEKDDKIEAKRNRVADAATKSEADRQKAEAEVNKARIAAITAAQASHVDEASDAPEAIETPVDQTEAPTEAKVEVKAEEKAEVKPEAKAEEKTETKPEAKAEVKPEAKAEEKTEAKPEAKAEEKTEAKPEAKAEEKTETKPEAKAEEKAEAKSQDEGKSKEEGKKE